MIRWIVAAGIAAGLSGWATSGRGDDIHTMVRLLGSPICENATDAGNANKDIQLMLQMELARQLLATIRVTPEMEAIRKRAIRHLDRFHDGMVELRRLGAQLPDVEGLIRKAIDATPAAIDALRKKELSKEEKEDVAALVLKGFGETIKAGIVAYEKSEALDKCREEYQLVRGEKWALINAAVKHCKAPNAMVFGIGLATEPGEDGLKVVEALANGPAALGGIRKGDQIVEVDGVRAGRTQTEKSGRTRS